MFAAAASSQSAPAPFSADPSAPEWPPTERFRLWPGKPPGAPAKEIARNWTMNNAPPNRELWIRGVEYPEVNVFRAPRPDGSALLALPGGGYGFLSVQNEGMAAAKRFNPAGTSVFVLTYRLPAEGWSERSIAPLQDAQRAMRLIRSRSRDFQIDPKRLGAIGFSAGGHLAADLGVSHAMASYPVVDEADALSAKPAYLGLLYPVISLDPKLSLGSSAPNLLGPDPSQQLVNSRSPARNVSSDTPPSFLAAAFDDPIVLPDNGLAWIEANRRNKVSVECHLFAQGGHGFGFHLPSNNPGSLWPDLFALWMREHGA